MVLEHLQDDLDRLFQLGVMALPDELLALAKELVDRNPGAAVGADLRRAVSTALRAYAAFATSAARGAVREVP